MYAWMYPFVCLTARCQDRIGLHLSIYGSRRMSPGDSGCPPGIVKVPSPAETGHQAVILMLGRYGWLGRRPQPSDGTVENTGICFNEIQQSDECLLWVS
jgi:hypothetical protein